MDIEQTIREFWDLQGLFDSVMQRYLSGVTPNSVITAG